MDYPIKLGNDTPCHLSATPYHCRTPLVIVGLDPTIQAIIGIIMDYQIFSGNDSWGVRAANDGWGVAV
jgi:hypothetical protein